MAGGTVDQFLGAAVQCPVLECSGPSIPWIGRSRHTEGACGVRIRRLPPTKPGARQRDDSTGVAVPVSGTEPSALTVRTRISVICTGARADNN